MATPMKRSSRSRERIISERLVRRPLAARAIPAA